MVMMDKAVMVLTVYMEATHMASCPVSSSCRGVKPCWTPHSSQRNTHTLKTAAAGTLLKLHSKHCTLMVLSKNKCKLLDEIGKWFNYQILDHVLPFSLIPHHFCLTIQCNSCTRAHVTTRKAFYHHSYDVSYNSDTEFYHLLTVRMSLSDQYSFRIIVCNSTAAQCVLYGQKYSIWTVTQFLCFCL